MQITIHRGTREIGGSCVEIRTNKTRLLIDFGMPLVDALGEPFDSRLLNQKNVNDLKKSKILPSIKGIYKSEKKYFDAIILSHSHLDHYGLLSYIHPQVPVYLSRGAYELIEISNLFTPHKVEIKNSRIISNKKTFVIGDCRITPYLVDHSAFDALAFLIEADGKRVFYSGDFRGHGRKRALYKKIIKNPPERIDCLLMEGTSLGKKDKNSKDEIFVEKEITKRLKSAENITFLFTSSQNIDRLVSAYKACLKTEAIFVIDIYTAFILDRLSGISKGIPQFNWRNIRVKFYKYQADILAKNGSINLLYKYNARKIEFDEINKRKKQVLMLARDNSLFPVILRNIPDVQGAKIIYSLWEGYLTDEFKRYCKGKGLIIEQIHASGHAKVADLKAFSNALKPKMLVLVPIHTFHAPEYPGLFKNVKLLKDGEVLNLN